MKSGAKREWFLFIPLFLRESEKLMCEKILSKRANFFVHVRLFESSFLQLLMVMRSDYDIVLVLGLF